MSSRHDRKRRYSDEREDRDRRRVSKHADESEDRDRRRKFKHADKEEDRSRRRPNRNYEKKHYEWGKDDKSPPRVVKEKEKPNFETTGKLAEETNTFRGVVIKYSEPPEARKPQTRWRLYPFKGDKALPVLHMHRQSGYLIGRDRKIADFAIDHPSCSKQHAVFQFRMIPKETEMGKTVQRIRPYILDLGSANGTHLNGKKIEPQKYYELFERDVLKFGYSTREYVLLHENSGDGTAAVDADTAEDAEDDV